MKQKYRGHLDEAARSQPPSTLSFLITATTGKKGSPEERHELQLAPRHQKNSIILDSPSYSFLLRKRGELGRNKRNTKNGERSIFKGLFFSNSCHRRPTAVKSDNKVSTKSLENKSNHRVLFLSLLIQAAFLFSSFSSAPLSRIWPRSS